MKFLILLLIFVTPMTTIYDFKMNSLDGELIDFSIYKGKTLLLLMLLRNVVTHLNTPISSKCKISMEVRL